jgi:KaiC/GvpD/RAD55 family RecA-like ATPase
MNDQLMERLTTAIEIMAKKDAVIAEEAEQREKRNKMWDKIGVATQGLQDEKRTKVDALVKSNRESENKLRDSYELKINKIENAIRKMHGETERKPYLSSNSDIACGPSYR